MDVVGCSLKIIANYFQLKWILFKAQGLPALRLIFPFQKNMTIKKIIYLGGSPGLVVMGGDSRSEGCGFESQHHILDGYILLLFVNCNVCLKRRK